ncbi:Type II/IV secretion system protein [Candidatus Bilamarchaeum dharawalense]|uniref:Type II/IV secretion system protein n=1 Tax=Candidatus Bilamarchaeum dharawalense TaxID=2885759 RepID=A0A5E4LLK9_9ARCH|nr:Type II/IV secretion system protein [Candidatus Bilamarchaeum dharawalense]
MIITTIIDKMVEIVQKNKKMDFKKIAKELSWDEESVEKIALLFHKAGLGMVHYPVNMVEQPWITILSTVPPESKHEEGKKVDEYVVPATGNHTSESVWILQSESERRPLYSIRRPRVSPYTRVYIEYLKTDIAKDLPIETSFSEEGATEKFHLRREMIKERIKKDLNPKADFLELISDLIVNEMYGLGELELLIGDARLEEIVVNTANLPVAVYHKRYGWMRTNIHLKTEESTRNYAEQIARKVGRQISMLNPILDAHLANGDRVNATLFPVSAHGNTITMRLFAKNPWTIVSYLKKENNSMSVEMAALLWQAMQYEMNVLIAGGTASGKTSALNGLISLIQPFQRIVTIEDTRELMLPTYQWNWVPLVTRLPNPEGAGEVTMLDLVVNALRMRPDRIVMGEIRRKREAEVLFEAMHTGHSVYSTIHADTGSQVIKRLVEPPIEVPASEVEDISLLVVQYRDRRKNVRRTLEVSEIVTTDGNPEVSKTYIWRPRGDNFQLVKPPHRYIEQMNIHTGMTEREVDEDQKSKRMVLEWMVKNKLENIEDIGRVMKSYYADEPGFIKIVSTNAPPSKVL